LSDDDTKMVKAISVKQPWANLIASGKKCIETRTWSTKFRGRLLIVSSKVPSEPPPAGHAVAIADLVDCRPMTKDDEEAACCPVYPNAYAWVLENVKAVKPFPVKGSQGFYMVNISGCEELL